MPLFGLRDKERQAYVDDRDEHLERVYQELLALQELTREHADAVASKVHEIRQIHRRR